MPAILPALVAFLQLAPKLIELITRLCQSISADVLAQWMVNLEAHIVALESAKSSKERQDAAEKLVGDIRGLG